ncbi:MAG TPA: hypothetical protein VHW25_08230 [Steroidobacteraceae bacterium]|nr:hypothetical protein [Steroidobacteraceae bacterium]
MGAVLMSGLAAAAQPTDPPAPQNSGPLAQVVVSAARLPREQLKRVAIQFVKSHGAVSPVIHQIGRWQAKVCPRVTGLQPAANAFVSRHVTEVAHSVGAPSGIGKGCPVNVEIVFTAQPQLLLNHIAKAYPALLGSSRSPSDATSHRAIQSWYTTGTRVMTGWTPPAPPITGPGGSIVIGAQAVGPNLMMALQQGVDASTPAGAVAGDGARIDPAYGGGYAGFGNAASYFTKGFTSEFLQVLVVVDTRKIATDSLSSISDYISMLALTRTESLDGCSELPSIIDLLSSGCGRRAKPLALTATDTAYLKALYSADLEKNLNLEQGDMRDRMVTTITGQ